MFIIRYLDVNKTVHMRINRTVAISSIIIGIIVALAFYCSNELVQMVALLIVIIYAVWINNDIIKKAFYLIKIQVKKLNQTDTNRRL